MSTGSKAALGVGVTLAILGVVALVFAFFLIRRHRRGQIAPPVDGTAFWGGQVHNPKEIDGTERRLGGTTQANGPYYEMSGNYRPAWEPSGIWFYVLKSYLYDLALGRRRDDDFVAV
jgi:hypothetical protein